MIVTNYMYRVKIFTQELITKNSQLKDEIEEEYYKLLIKIAKEECSDQDIQNYYFKLKDLKNKT